MRIGVLRETVSGERRVALIPDAVAKLVAAGHQIAVQRGAGEAAGFLDAAYEKAGATLAADAAALCGGNPEIVVKVRKPSSAEAALLPKGSTLVALLTPGSNDDLLPALKERGLTALALELVPRISRAQSMDVLSSQSGVAGYKAVLVGASALDKFLPMLTTAAGSIAPAKAFVLGAGVAGLQAIATARRLGAVVSAFDVRSAAGEQVRSLGAQFVEPAAKAEGTGGYARAQTEDEASQNAAIIADHIKSQDLVLTTALIPGRKAPILVTDAMLASMRPGSVVLDLAAESGGNVEGSVPGETVVRHGVQLIGVANIAASVPLHASQMFSTNVRTLLTHLSGENGALTVNAADEITGPMLVVHNGAVPVKAS
jgi:NAD(P) transhydrogenase subunit alpha